MGREHPTRHHRAVFWSSEALKKKLHWYTTFGVIRTVSQVMRSGRRGARCHPFRDFAKVSNRSSSLALQRRIVDFSAEGSFQSTAIALKEHYRIEVPIYAIDKATAVIAKQSKHFNSQAPEGIKPVDTLISQVDGSMLPIVHFSEETTDGQVGKRTDRRKLRQYHWKEIRVSTVRVPGSVDTWYGVALGKPLSVGCMMLECCKFKGMHPGTHIHAIGDGASWIANQYDLQFGTRCKFTIDFWHACDYLVAAAKSTTMSDKERKCWFEAQKESLRASKVKTVLATLEDLADAKDDGDESDPITTTISYFKKREDQFDYADAIRRELPIGSGEVESAHRHILQKRLKIPGAWWRLERAEEMAQLRAMRANQRWNDFWNQKVA